MSVLVARARRYPVAALASLACAASLWACALGAAKPAAPLATSLQELVPHGDRDHFVYVIERVGGDKVRPDGIQVEHITALREPGEFEVTLSENGIGTGRVHIRDDGTTIWIVSEDDLSSGVRLTYDPPIPYLRVPLVAGDWQAASTAKITRLADGGPAGTLELTQVVHASAAPPGDTRLGAHGPAVSLHTERRLTGPDGEIGLTTTILLVPSIGEVRSEGTVTGMPTLRRELACAIIGGRPIGDCSRLNQ